MSFNRIIIIGNLTREPALTYLPNQTPVVEFGLANNRKYKAADGSQKEEVCFVDCRAYGKTADTITQWFHRGDPILIEGRLQFDQWQADDGSKRSKHRVLIERFEFLPSSKQQTTDKTQSPAEQERPYTPPDDDVPF